MYEAYYGLKEKPFSILPDPEMIYWGRNHQLALAVLEFGVLNSAGFTVITGEIGAGKTTLLQYLLSQLPNGVNVGLISNTPESRKEMLEYILMSLDQPFDGSYSSLLHRFQQFLQAQHAKHRRTILIVDEAQNLHPNALESLRMLSNVNIGKDLLLQLILVGQPQLKTLLSSPNLVQFAQRVSADFHLRALNAREVEEYINYRLTAAGAQRPLFDSEACAFIAQQSAGIPRTVNILCDTALVYGYSSEAPIITKDIVEDVITHKRALGAFAH